MRCVLPPNAEPGIFLAYSLGGATINTLRGPLVVEQDLANALSDGHLAGAGVDVLSSEPPLNNPLLHAKIASSRGTSRGRQKKPACV